MDLHNSRPVWKHLPLHLIRESAIYSPYFLTYFTGSNAGNHETLPIPLSSLWPFPTWASSLQNYHGQEYELQVHPSRDTLCLSTPWPGLWLRPCELLWTTDRTPTNLTASQDWGVCLGTGWSSGIAATATGEHVQLAFRVTEERCLEQTDSHHRNAAWSQAAPAQPRQGLRTRPENKWLICC